MGNFMGSYHWKTLRDFVTRLFVAANQAAMMALETAASPNQARRGDLCYRQDADNQWYIMSQDCPTPGGVPTPTPGGGDWTAITPWEASLIAVNAIAQFPGDVHIQDVLDNILSGITGAPPVGNPFDIVAAATFGIGAGVAAPANDNVEAVGSVIATADVVATAGWIATGLGAAPGNVEAAQDVIAGNDVVATRAIGVGVAAPGVGVIDAAAQAIGGTGVVATAGDIEAVAGNIITAPVTGLEVQAGARVIGTTGLQAGVTAGDRVIARIRRSVLNLAGNAALGAMTTADENLAAVVPATAICIGIQPNAAMVANSVVQARVNAANVIQVRYANIQKAGNINVATDANFQVLWMVTNAI